MALGLCRGLLTLITITYIINIKGCPKMIHPFFLILRGEKRWVRMLASRFCLVKNGIFI